MSRKQGKDILTIESDDEIEIEPESDGDQTKDSSDDEITKDFTFNTSGGFGEISKTNFLAGITPTHGNMYKIPMKPADSDEENSDVEEQQEEEEEEEPEPVYERDPDEEVSGDEDQDTLKGMNEENIDDDVDDLEKDYDKSYFSEVNTGEVIEEVGSFLDLNLSKPLLKAISDLDYTTPTPIQKKSIPVGLGGRDICASSVTGSGKTAAFVLPILERMMFRDRTQTGTRALILLPTRELAIQCFNVIQQLAKYTDIRACLAVGGTPLKTQVEALKSNPEILVCTPGRLIDHLMNTTGFSFHTIEILVLDEADRLLELGFKDELEQIVEYCPKARQTMLFSATMTDEVDKLIQLSLKNPVRIQIEKKTSTVTTLLQEFIKVKNKKEDQKEAMLMWICTKTYTTGVIIFCAMKVQCSRLRKLFYLRGLNCRELHGNMAQDERLLALDDFAKHRCDFLICTDVAARGIDIKGLNTVINFDMPQDLVPYLHRVGRTARAGQSGTSVSFVTDKDRPLLKKVVKRAKQQHNQVKQRTIPLAAITLWQRRIEILEPKIVELIDEQRTNLQLKKMTMSLNKAQNLLTHSEEIKGRPARTWFKTEAEKKKTKKEVLRDYKSHDSSKQPQKKFKKMNRTQSRAKRLDAETLQHHGLKSAGVTQKLAKHGVKRGRNEKATKNKKQK